MIGFCFYHRYFHIWYSCWYENYLLLLICNIFFLVVQKGFNIFNYFVFDFCLWFGFLGFCLPPYTLLTRVGLQFSLSYSFMFNTTHSFLWLGDIVNYLIVPSAFCKQSLFPHFFFFKRININYGYVNWLKK